jgi:hypothetical protein
MKGRSFYEWRFTVPSKSPFVKRKDDPKLRPDRRDGDGPDGSWGRLPPVSDREIEYVFDLFDIPRSAQPLR